MIRTVTGIVVVMVAVLLGGCGSDSDGSGDAQATGGSYLVAVIEIDGEFVEVRTKAAPEGTVEQLRPIADELLPKVESELR